MITTLIVLYILIGLAIAYYEYVGSQPYLSAVKLCYPRYSRVIAMIIAGLIITLIWPYVLYEIIRDKE